MASSDSQHVAGTSRGTPKTHDGGLRDHGAGCTRTDSDQDICRSVRGGSEGGEESQARGGAGGGRGGGAGQSGGAGKRAVANFDEGFGRGGGPGRRRYDFRKDAQRP